MSEAASSPQGIYPVSLLDQLPGLSWPEKLAYLTVKFLALPQIECPVVHKFEGGEYIREIAIPQGTLFIGRPHRHGHKCDLLSGKIIHITQDFRLQRIAPFSIKTAPGYQAVFYTETDILGRSVHPNPTDSRDIEALELDAFHTVDEMKALGMEAAHKLKQVA